MTRLIGVAMELAGLTGRASLAGVVAVAALATLPAHAGPVITNAGFEDVTTSVSTEFGTRFGGPAVVASWTTGGYNFLFKPGTADTTGAANEFNQHLTLWGPGNGSDNGLPASSPDGGNFIAADGAFGQQAIQQTITGMGVNSIASVSFWWAGAQQHGYDGATTEAWQVSLGNQTKTTTPVNDLNHGFTGWQKTTLSFVVTNATEVLSFLAIGTPGGLPPFSLLDGVSITEVPEPTSLALLGAGLGLAGLMARRRRAAA